MEVFARFKKKNWCIDLAYAAKIAEDFNGAKFLLIRQDLCGRTVDAKGMSTQDSK